MALLSSAVYEEMAGSPSETRTDGGRRVTRVLRCDWADRIALAEEALGISEYTGVYPISADDADDGCRCRSASIRPDGELITGTDGDGQPTYEKAEITLSFETRADESAPTDSSGEVTILEESLTPAAEFIVADSRKLYWVWSGTVADRVPVYEIESPQVIVRQAEWTVTVHNLSSIPAAVISKMGMCNADAVTSATLGVTFPAETLLFMGGVPSRTLVRGRRTFWRCSMKFMARPYSWNKFWRRGASTPEYMKVEGGGDFEPVTKTSFADLNLRFG